MPRWQTTTCRSDTGGRWLGSSCSRPVALSCEALQTCHARAPTGYVRCATLGDRRGTVLSSPPPTHDMPPRAHCHTLEFGRIVRPRDTCAVPSHRARRPLLLGIAATCSCRRPDSQTSRQETWTIHPEVGPVCKPISIEVFGWVDTARMSSARE